MHNVAHVRLCRKQLDIIEFEWILIIARNLFKEISCRILLTLARFPNILQWTY